jgi:hypothetical protein
MIFHELVIHNAPYLQRLIILSLAGPTKIYVIEAPKLIVLAYESTESSELVIGEILIDLHRYFSSS